MVQENPTSPFEIGKDLWIRARTNAFANELAVSYYTRFSNILYGLELFFLVSAIGLVSYSYSIAGSATGSNPNTLFPLFSLLTVIFNTIALYISIFSVKLSLSESAFRYKEQLSMYSLISQKARQLDHSMHDDEDALKFAVYLQDLFEITKSRGIEPDNKFFIKGKTLLKGLNTYPFGLTKNDL
ncbi:MAG: hypothetical protein ABFD29_03670 [Anaerolineaceae bacterium]